MSRTTYLIKLGLLVLVLMGGVGSIVVLYAITQLPSVEVLEDVHLQVPLKIYSREGMLIAEYGDKRRSPLAIHDIPKPLIYALLATEDRRFYEHKGVDMRGLLRAAFVLISRGSKEQGGSTITMQVARNFFLTRHKTFTRKLNEILLALKIERELPKDKILELYLNKVYFGKGAYGVEAAAEVYYGKTVKELTLAEMAMIAGLPQAPSAVNPINNPKGAQKRRQHVLSRMFHYGFINEEQLTIAEQEPLNASYHGRVVEVDAPYVAEMVRQELIDHFGDDVYASGFEVYTTINGRMQNAATHTVQNALLDYDARHGYRGPIGTLPLDEDISTTLRDIPSFETLKPVVITQLTNETAEAKNSRHETVVIPWLGLRWARKQLGPDRVSNEWPEKPSDILKPGDIVYVRKIGQHYHLAQVPEISGALVALSPNNGDVLSVVGGFDFQLSKFNRASQAARQPGSVFKPFIYLAAFEQGYTPASLINDAPIVFDIASEDSWRPQNDNKKFYGPTRLRTCLTLSRNLATIRLLQAVGIANTLPILERFGFDPNRLPRDLTLALGTLTASPMEITTAYASFANGGYRVFPRLIHHIEDEQGHIVYENKTVAVCPNCDTSSAPDFAQITPAERIISVEDAYIMTNILQDAIQTGTGKQAKSLGRKDLSGKTGSTNQHVDGWYAGYNADLVATTWMGFDDPRSIGEYAAQSALPMWIDFMDKALKGKPEHSMAQPPGIQVVKIDPVTGLLARPNQPDAIFELFKTGEVPTRTAPMPSNNQNTKNNRRQSSDEENTVDVEDIF